MAYNPNLYNPYGQTWGQQSWQMPTQPVNGLVSVTGMEGAKAYQMPPNSSMPLFDGDSDILYLKTTDAAGYPTIRTFRFEPMEVSDTQPAAADYVPRSEFEELARKVDGLAKPEPKPRQRKAASDGE